MSTPVVSVAIATFNGARYLEAAVRSALVQDLRDLEVIIVDDCSTDDSAALGERIAQGDARVRVERLSGRAGPGGARNRALELAHGEWLAVLDCDDLMHPARLARLVARARQDGADIVADDLVVFNESALDRSHRFLGRNRSRAPTWLSVEDFLRETELFGRTPNLGYLKPLIRLAPWRACGVRYDEALAIGEDHDLMLRLLMAGLRCRIDPFPGYFYRRHSSSTSHRLSAEALDRIEQAEARHRARMTGASPSVTRLMDRRRSAIEAAVAFNQAVAALKARHPIEAGKAVLSRPRSLTLFGIPIADALKRLAEPFQLRPGVLPIRQSDPTLAVSPLDRMSPPSPVARAAGKEA